MCPARSTARETGASFSRDRCVRVRQQHVTKMALAYYEDMSDAFQADRTEQPFCVRVRLREKLTLPPSFIQF
jgi:hypothetical protein